MLGYYSKCSICKSRGIFKKDVCDECLKEKEEEQKDTKKLPEWNTRLDVMTKGIGDCNNTELYYLKNEIDKEIILSNQSINEGF